MGAIFFGLEVRLKEANRVEVVYNANLRCKSHRGEQGSSFSSSQARASVSPRVPALRYEWPEAAMLNASLNAASFPFHM